MERKSVSRYFRSMLPSLRHAALAALLCMATAAPASDIMTAERAEQTLRSAQEQFMKNNIALAFAQLSEVRDYFSNTHDEELLFEATVYLSMIHQAIGLQQEAYDMLKAVPFREVKSTRQFSSQYYLRLMGYFSSHIDKDYARTEQWTARLIDYDRRTYPDDPALQYIDQANLAEACILLGNRDKARSLIAEVEAKPRPRYTYYISQLAYSHGLLLFEEGRYEEAYRQFERGVGSAREWGGIDNVAMNERYMMRIDSIRGDLGAYIAHRNEADSIDKVLSSTELRYRIAVINEQHKTELMRQQTAKARLLAVLLSVLAVLLIALLLLIIKRNQARRRLTEAQLREKDARNERDQLEKELMQLRMRQKEEQLTEARNDNVELSRQLANKEEPVAREDKLQAIEASFRSANTAFIRMMEDRFPQLTRNDMLLVSLLKMGMKPQDMAQLLAISMDSLRKTRYRLRKKLAIPGDDDIKEWLDALPV